MAVLLFGLVFADFLTQNREKTKSPGADMNHEILIGS